MLHLCLSTDFFLDENGVTIKSQEFLGVEEEFKLVVDVAKGVEKKKKDVDVDDDTEGKKDK